MPKKIDIYKELEKSLMSLKNNEILETGAGLSDALCSTTWMQSCAIKKNNKITYFLIMDENRGGPEKIEEDDFLDFCGNHEFKSRDEEMSIYINKIEKFNMKKFLKENFEKEDLSSLLKKHL
jgi:hypothetical protein